MTWSQDGVDIVSLPTSPGGEGLVEAVACEDGLAPGVYDIKVTAPGFEDYTTTATLGDDCATVTIDVALTPSATTTCQPCCTQSYPKTLTLTFKATAITLTWDATNGVWVGCQAFTSGANRVHTGGYTFDPEARTCTCDDIFMTGTAVSGILFQLSMVDDHDGSCHWLLSASIQCCVGCGWIAEPCNDDPTAYGWVSAGTGTLAVDCTQESVDLDMTLNSEVGACGSLNGFFGDGGIGGPVPYDVTITE